MPALEGGWADGLLAGPHAAQHQVEQHLGVVVAAKVEAQLVAVGALKGVHVVEREVVGRLFWGGGGSPFLPLPFANRQVAMEGHHLPIAFV
jgi:hypothetical protein